MSQIVLGISEHAKDLLYVIRFITVYHPNRSDVHSVMLLE